MKELLPFVRKVYGRVLTQGKLTPEMQGDSPKEIHWCPRPKDLAMAQALVATDKIRPYFIVRIAPASSGEEDSTMLQPFGVVFWSSSMTFATADAKLDFVKIL